MLDPAQQSCRHPVDRMHEDAGHLRRYGEDDRVDVELLVAGDQPPAGPGRFERVDRGAGPHRREPGRQGIDQVAHAVPRREEHRCLRIARGGRPDGPRPEDHVGRGGRRSKLRRGRSDAERVRVAGVDAADERSDQPVEHLVAQPRAHDRSDRHILAVGQRGTGVAAGPCEARGGEDSGAPHVVQIGRDAQQASRSGAAAARVRPRRSADRSAGETRRSVRPSSAASRIPAGCRARNASAPASTARPANGVVRILPPSRSDASQHDHVLDRLRRRELEGCGQPGDAAADDGEPHRTADGNAEATSTTTPARPANTAGSSLRASVRAKASPCAAARSWASMSRS